MLESALCGLSGHRINRRRVWHDSINFRTDCDRCGKGLIRGISGWIEFVETAHGQPDRKSREEAEALAAEARHRA